MNFMVICRQQKKCTCKEVLVRSSCFLSDPLSYNIWRRGCLMFYRKITEFDKPNEDWVSYVKRMTLFFEANGTEEGTKKKRLFCYRVSEHRRTSF